MPDPRRQHPTQNQCTLKPEEPLKTASLEPLELEPGLFLDTAWHSNYDRSDNSFEISDPPFIESVIEDGADFYDHLKRHQLFRDLVDLAYWQPTGYYRIQASRDEDIELKSRRWREVKTYLVRPQEEGHSATALFYFGQIGVEGFQKWAEMRHKYDRAIGPLMSLLGMKGSAVETQFIQSCVGLEGLGVQLARDDGINKREKLQKRLERVVDDLGFSFSEDWAKRTADRYNDIKHYDRDAVVDPLDVRYNLLENELVFRSWVALRLGLSRDYVMTRIDITPAGQALIGQPGISFPKPTKESVE
ncbi:HEPN domain-containing protein [Corynebacterium striatum]|uniref:ApeA N-terminal domain 1-containing protein n=1 Tax=Corynebacterium striatum TaxID=43770 RepID=UPI003B58D348